MRRIGLAGLSVALLVSGATLADSAEACVDAPSMSFAAPTRVGTGSGYEPGLEIDSRGNVWVTAHKLSLAREESTRLNSFLYRSTDDGATFQDVVDVLPVSHPLWALEGDLAVDANDRMYYADTWAADDHFYRFAPDGSLEMARPVLPSWEVDDRPWLAAHHDGVVYYLSNTGYTPNGRLTVHRSTDRGATFDLGFTFPDSGWGFLDADPNSDNVYVVMNDYFYGSGLLGDATGVFVWRSADRGLTWNRVKIADYEIGYQIRADHDDAYPVVAVSPVDGTVYALWTDDGRKVMLGQSTDKGQTWSVDDVTPFPGVFSFPWLAVGPNGDVGVTFEAKRDDDPSLQQNIYAMLVRPNPDCLVDGEECVGPATVTGQVNTALLGTDFNTQADFFQTDFSPTTGKMHVVWTGRSNQLYHARQSTGPNLARTAFCGRHG